MQESSKKSVRKERWHEGEISNQDRTIEPMHDAGPQLPTVFTAIFVP